MTRFAAIAIILSVSSAAFPGSDALIRVGRTGPHDRAALLAAGVPLVKELGPFLLAYGPPGTVLPRLEAAGYAGRVLDRPAHGESYHLLGLREGADWPAGPRCGLPVWVEGGAAVVKTSGAVRPPCAAGSAVRWAPLSLEPLKPVREAPPRSARAAEAQPLVQAMVDGLTDAVMADALEEVVGWASTRYSFSSGCRDAVEAAAEAFGAAGLPVQFQEWSGKFPPNVIAEIRGAAHPEDVFIVIAHLDDMPEVPPAPGADDNASGSAMVLALARAMAPYRFAGTVKFILVTGEEQGLVGSTIYALDADRRGENIRAVLNADMIGWQGDGQPDVEDIDINYDVASEWLALLMHEASNLYGTGGPVNAFPCPSMVYSDHASFWDYGWAAVCGITDNEGFCHQPGTYPYYHTHNDTVANCGDLSFFAGASRTFLATLAHLAVPTEQRHMRPLDRP
jgi:hypothetical protein